MAKKKKNTRKWSKAGNVAKKVVPVIVAVGGLTYKYGKYAVIAARKVVFKV